MKFSYHLVLGSSRAEAPGPALAMPRTPGQGERGHQQSKIMRVPIRMYNNVSGMFCLTLDVDFCTQLRSRTLLVEKPSIPYDLLWPLARRRTGPVKTTVTEDSPTSAVIHRSLGECGPVM